MIGAVLLIMAIRNLAKAGAQKHELEEAAAKKAAEEAIAMYEMAYGDGPSTAHDVFMAMQEIPYIMKAEHTSEDKLLRLEENMARALTLRWSDYDLPKAVSF